MFQPKRKTLWLFSLLSIIDLFLILTTLFDRVFVGTAPPFALPCCPTTVPAAFPCSSGSMLSAGRGSFQYGSLIVVVSMGTSIRVDSTSVWDAYL